MFYFKYLWRDLIRFCDNRKQKLGCSSMCHVGGVFDSTISAQTDTISLQHNTLHNLHSVSRRKESENHHSTSFEVVGWLVHLHLNYSKTFTFVFELRHWDKSWGGPSLTTISYWQQHIELSTIIILGKNIIKNTSVCVINVFKKYVFVVPQSWLRGGELPVHLVTRPSASEGVERSSQYRILVIFSSQSS